MELRAVDVRACVNTIDILRPTGMPLELVVKDDIEAWKVLGGKVSMMEAAQEFAPRRIPVLLSKTLPEAVDEMVKTKVY